MLKSIKLKYLLSMAVLAFVTLFSACDDSDEKGSQVVLSSFGPSGVHFGDKIKFLGQNLDKVTAIVLPPAVEISSSSFASQSATMIELVIPPTTERGRVILKTPAGDIESKSFLDLEVPVTITSITEEAKPGTTITITGENINWIETVTFTANLTVEKEDFVSQSGTELVVTVPMNAKTGILTVTTGGTEPLIIDSEEELIVTLPVVTALDPTSIRHTDDLTITGTDLDLVTQIKFSGGAIVDEFTEQTDSKIVVSVPETTTTGKLTLSVASGVTVQSGTLTIILPNVTALSPSNTANHTAGTTLIMTGTDLDLVGKIAFPGVTEPVASDDFESQSATEIQVVLPDGVEGGTVVLTTIHGFTVPVSLPFGNQLILAKVIFDDAIHTPLGAGGGWGGVITDAASTEKPRVGTVSIKVTFANSWGGGGQFGNWSTGQTLSTSGMTYYAFSIFGGPGTNGKVINANVSGVQAQVTIEEGKWKDVSIPLSSVGSPAGIGEIWFQDQGWAGVVYIDHIGLK